MNKLAACLALAIAPSLLSAVEKPDGLLGVDYVGLSGMYANVSYENVDMDYNGVAASFNKNLFRSDSGVGFDLGTTLIYSRNLNMREIADTNSTQGTLDLTLFQDGLAAPFATLSLGNVNASEDSGGANYDFDSFVYGGTVGVEVHVFPGISATPYVAYLDSTEDNAGGQTYAGLKATWWITSRIGLNTDANYANVNHSDMLTAVFGALFHY
jgi:hypothetical protein